MNIQLPRPRGDEENFEIVSVNGKRDKLMKGVAMEVPAAVSEVLLHRELAQRAAARYLERVSAR